LTFREKEDIIKNGQPGR